MSSIQSLRDCTEICRALIRFSGAKCQRGICYFLRQVSLSINLSLFVLLFGVNVPHAFAQVEYFTFTTQTGTGAGDSFTGYFSGSNGLLSTFISGTYYGATYIPSDNVPVSKDPGPTGIVSNAVGTYSKGGQKYFGAYSGSNMTVLSMNFDVGGSSYYQYAFAYPTYFTDPNNPVLFFTGRIDGGSTNIVGTPSYSFSSGAPEIDGSLAPKVAFLLFCLFLLFGKRRHTSESGSLRTETFHHP